MASVNDELQDKAIARAIEIGRYGNGVAVKIFRLLNGADAEIVGKLAERLANIEERGIDLGPSSTARLNKLLDELRKLNSAIYDRVHNALVDELTDFADAEGAYQRAALNAAIPVEVGAVVPAPAVLRAIVEESPMEGRLLKSWTAGMEAGRADRIEQAIRLGMVQGESTDTIVRRIKGTKAARYTDGVLDISRRSAQSIVRTAVNHVHNQAAQQTWKANDHIVKAWQYLATLDNRTTTTCAGLSGQTFPIGEGPIPPRHIRCRSISVPVTKSWRELGIDKDEADSGTRASMDGQVPADTTMAKWLTQKGEATQNEILGPTRAKLWREGKVSLQDLIKADGTVLTLDELRARHKL